MKRSTNGILSTHTGSLPRPRQLLEMLVARDQGKPVDPKAFDTAVRQAVGDSVKRQAEVGITVLNDGEMSKMSYATYVKDRLTGFEGEENTRLGTPTETDDFPEYTARWFSNISRFRRPCCNGPIQWKDFAAVQRDIENLKAATRGVKGEDVFMTAPSPGTISNFHPNRYYKTEEEYLYTLADVMNREYGAIVQAGFVLQLDCPDLSGGVARRRGPRVSLAEVRKDVALRVGALNRAVENIPAEQVRVHVCWGANEGPHHLDTPLKDIVDILLTARPVGLTIVGANGRHEYEWKVWKDVKVPEGKVIIPGVIDSTTNIIEHPELVAERLVRYAGVLGKENIMAGVDCGFATIAGMDQVDPRIAWAKLRALAQGTDLATRELWRK